jgi:hypothetical protein
MIFRRVFRRLFGGNEWTGAKGKTDFRMTVAPDGTISARCHECGEPMRVREERDRVWFICDRCGKQAYYAAEDAARDRWQASRSGEPVTVDLYFYDELPDNVRPPD